MAKYQLLAFALTLHTLFWGAGAAWWAMPRRWRRWWPVAMPLMGLALQSAAVWIGAHLGLAGTQQYAAASLLLPGLLGLAAAWNMGRQGWLAFWRLRWVLLVSAACLAGLVWPLGKASHALTTASLGSCDAADYASGARVLQEFRATEREGFLGHTDVVRVHSTDNFFDYWLRLNHFTPSALVAHHGAIFGCQPHEITGLATATLLALGVPLVWWLARALFGHGPWASLALAALYGASPLLWYAVFQVSPGQLLAAQAIGWLTWAGVRVWRERGRAEAGGAPVPGSEGERAARRWRWTGTAWWASVAAAAWLLLGAYNFFIVACLAPVALFVCWETLRLRAWRRFGRWLLALAPPFIAAALFAWPRVAGLIERFLLLREYDFGWKIPILTPEGWWGLVGGSGLEPWPDPVRWMLGGALVALFAFGFWRASVRSGGRALLAASCLAPALAGYAFLAWRGERLGTNASYDAYKWLCVFYPCVLPALALATEALTGGGRSTARWRRVPEGALLAALVVGNAFASTRMAERMTQPPLIVDRALRELRTVERFPQVQSVNLLVENFWERLWAHAHLLRKRQYFPSHTYEARRNTPLRGQWDLEAGLVRVRPPDPAHRIEINSRYALVLAEGPYALRARLADGWHAEERLVHAGLSWNWTGGDAAVEVTNPSARPLRCVVRCEAASGGGARDWSLSLDEGGAVVRHVGRERTALDFGEVKLPPGTHRLWFRSEAVPAAKAGGTAGDARKLGVQAYRIELELLP